MCCNFIVHAPEICVRLSIEVWNFGRLQMFTVYYLGALHPMKLGLVGKSVLSLALSNAICLSILTMVPVNADEKNTGDIIVEISGASSDNGKILWRMFNRKQDFDDPETGGLIDGECEIVNRKCTFTIPAIAFGKYAIMAGHDANNDEDISKNPFSNEPKGISNYTEKILWFPDFKKAKFLHDQPATAIRLFLF
jgi:uncharacterized protein (DUF2141 family)